MVHFLYWLIDFRLIIVHGSWAAHLINPANIADKGCRKNREKIRVFRNNPDFV